MLMRPKFLNVDLQLCAEFDLQPLLTNFDLAGFALLNCKTLEGKWYATIEPSQSFNNQEDAIEDLLRYIKSLDGALLNIWSNCLYREFDIGVDLPQDYVGASHPISNDLLHKIAEVKGSLAFTAYVPTKIK